MSYASRQAGVPVGSSAGGAAEDERPKSKGSVRAARLAAQKAQRQGNGPSGRSQIVGLPSKPNQLVSSNPGQPRARPQQMPTPPSSSDSALSPTPEWPLQGSFADTTPRSSPNRTKASERGPPPQRPPRPSYVPSMLDPSMPSNLLSPQQQPQQESLRSPQTAWQDDDFLSPTYASPNPSRPLTTSSQATVSSLGSIPDFPVPVPAAQPPRKSPNLGPPPSARRGPSSYYSQLSYVSPIVEESEPARSHGSYASSNVIPSGVTDFYFDDGDGTPSDEEIPIASPLSDGRESRSGDHDEQSGLVRKASLGRRQKPSITTIKSSDSVRSTSDKKKAGKVAQAAMAAGAAGGAFAAGLGSKESSIRNTATPESIALSTGTGLLDPSSSSSSESVDTLPRQKPEAGERLKSPITRSRSPLAPPDSKMAHTPDFEKSDELGPPRAYPLNQQSQSSLAARVGARRPPRLNVDAVKEAEARGSLTSLPDLIKRATRLAHNLDRGRTASKLGMDFFDADSLEREKARGDYGPRRSVGSLSDILASFPPPALGTPTGEKAPSQTLTTWPSGMALEHTNTQRYSEPPEQGKRRRRCCGLPLWGFILLMTILVSLIAAAVVIPVVLIVLPKHHVSAQAAADNDLAQCRKSTNCQNGGGVVLTASGGCACLCANGFTGDHCTTASDSGCTTADIADTSNATLGSSIPRLLKGAESNFNVPLNASLLLVLFSTTNLSCTSENALVTFNGLSSRSIDLSEPLLDAVLEPLPATHTAPPTITSPAAVRRQDSNTDYVAETSNGIIFAAPPSSYVSYAPYAAATSTPSPSSTSSRSSSPSQVPTTSNATALDFARIAVLFVMQDTQSLDAATVAQEQLQTFFESSDSTTGQTANARNVTLGGGYDINLVDLKLNLANGTTIGGDPTHNSTKRRSLLGW